MTAQRGKPLQASRVPEMVQAMERRPDLAEARLPGAVVAEWVRWSA